jgi:hypothetical protein
MKHFITHIKDVNGNNYLGIKIPNNLVEPFLQQLKEYIGEDDFVEFTKNQQIRDGGGFHLTVINVADYNRLMSYMGVDNFVNSLDKILTLEVGDLRMLGIGTATKSINRTFFIVCQSEILESVRTRFDLPEHDFHITIGFKDKDVFGVRKNEVLKKGDKFLQLLKLEFYKNDNWNFIKDIGNFDLDKSQEIIPVGITETNMKFKCDGHYLTVGFLEEGEKFWVMAKWPIDEELPRLAETEIAKVINKN